MSTPADLQPTLSFLTGLSQNNHKAWFEAHRPGYNAARAAFEALVGDLIAEFRESDDLKGLAAKDCVARIYRDVRFSKDKTPYKTNLSALIGPGGWKGNWSGYYLSISPDGQSLVAGGLYSPTAEQLNRFRQVIARNAAPFKTVTQDPAFRAIFGAVDGERLKTAPTGYDRTHPEIALLQLKQITALHRFANDEVLTGDFTEKVVSACRALRPFLDYLQSIQD